MTDGEIVASYRNATDKAKQLRIIADLTCRTPEQIANVLASYGENIPYSPLELRPYRKWTADDEARLLKLRREGCTYKEIGELIRHTENSVRSRLSKMRMEGRNEGV